MILALIQPGIETVLEFKHVSNLVPIQQALKHGLKSC